MHANTFSLRRLFMLLAIVATLLTSLLTMTLSSSGPDTDTDTAARNCVAHRTAICRQTPFPL